MEACGQENRNENANESVLHHLRLTPREKLVFRRLDAPSGSVMLDYFKVISSPGLKWNANRIVANLLGFSHPIFINFTPISAKI